MQVTLEKLEIHMEKECAAKLILCAKCQDKFPLIIYEDHVEVCPGAVGNPPKNALLDQKQMIEAKMEANYNKEQEV